MKPRCLLYQWVICMLVTSAVASAQVISVSQVQGTVQDSTGAVLPGVDLKITQTDTGLVRTTVSGADGGYLFPALPVGPYRLEATLQGFKTYVQDGIVLQVNTNPRIVITMAVGTVSDQITVTANAPIVETKSTAVGQVIDQQRIAELPLNTRDVTQLIVLTGAANDGRTTRGNYGSGAAGAIGATAFPSLAGGITGSVAFSLDGGTHNDPLNNGNLPFPFPDALRNSRSRRARWTRRYGYHSSGAVNVVTKAGANIVHGSGFEFTRNSKFNAQRAFTTIPENSRRNQFGGTFGGPIVQNRLFYFGAYQGTVQDQVDSFTATVPTAAMLQGDFTTVTSPACRTTGAVTLSPALGFVDNRIDPSRLSPIALNFANRYLPVNLGGSVRPGVLSGSCAGQQPDRKPVGGARRLPDDPASVPVRAAVQHPSHAAGRRRDGEPAVSAAGRPTQQCVFVGRRPHLRHQLPDGKSVPGHLQLQRAGPRHTFVFQLCRSGDHQYQPGGFSQVHQRLQCDRARSTSARTCLDSRIGRFRYPRTCRRPSRAARIRSITGGTSST